MHDTALLLSSESLHSTAVATDILPHLLGWHPGSCSEPTLPGLASSANSATFALRVRIDAGRSRSRPRPGNRPGSCLGWRPWRKAEVVCSRKMQFRSASTTTTTSEIPGLNFSISLSLAQSPASCLLERILSQPETSFALRLLSEGSLYLGALPL